MPAKNVVIAAAVIAGTVASASSLNTANSAPQLGSAASTKGAANPAPHVNYLPAYTFDAFVKGYGKTYATAEERNAREAIFNANVKRMIEFNKQPNKSYYMNVNPMADWTAAEIKGIRMGQVPNVRNGLYEKLKVIDRDVTEKGAKKRMFKLPASVDWRNHSVVTPVKDQGGCGSCWAFASTETMESHWAIKTHQLYELSTQQVTECTPNPNHCGGSGGCNGATENLAFEYIINNGGITTAAAYPYSGTDTGCHVPANAPRVANFSSIVKVKTNDQQDMLEVVATAGPVTIGVWADPMSFYGGGVFDGCSYSANMDIDHAVQLVGYGTDASLGKDYWIVRNSWGQWWGEGGYIRLQRDAEAQCGMDTTPQDGSACKNDPDTPIKVCGQCGLLYESSYPVPEVKAHQAL